MKNLFNSVKMMRPKSNNFDLTHDVKMSGMMGDLMPCCIVEAVPGDKMKLGSDVYLKFAPLIAPVMHRMDVYVHYFFVPNRIVWPNWEKFITNEPTGGLPYVTAHGGLSASQQKFMDYMGVPPCPPTGIGHAVNAIPFAAYQMIYNEYYRDENLCPEVTFELTDGDNSTNTDLITMRQRAWEHDYFTACLPWAQKGASVDLPLGEVYLRDDWDTYGNPRMKNIFNTEVNGGDVQQHDNTAPPHLRVNDGGIITDPVAYDPDGSLLVGATTINELRRAEKLQEWLERNARGGTRYIEQILAHFGVKSSDARLNRPEYIFGSKTPVVISEVLNTTGSFSGLEETSPVQGNMSGHATAINGSYQGTYYVEEHGYLIGVISVRPKTAYQQGIPKTYLKFDPLDYYWPSFAHIGEQEVLGEEIYAYSSLNVGQTFGYVPRYAEYKYVPSRVAGDFRTSLSYWHLGRIFQTAPTLSQEFIECTQEDCNRIFAVNDGTDILYIQVLNKIKARRPMPVFGTPML